MKFTSTLALALALATAHAAEDAGVGGLSGGDGAAAASAPGAVSASGAVSDVVVDSGACKAAFTDLCSHITPGNGRAANCLRSKNAAAKNRGKPKLASDCDEAVSQYFISVAKDPVKLNPELAKECAEELTSLCGDQDDKMLCLKKKKLKLGDSCKAKVFKEQLAAAADLRLDISLYSKCKEDIQTSCKKIRPGEGRLHNCLKSKYNSKDPAETLTDTCKAAVFQSKIEKSEDIRLDVAAKSKCESEIEKFCSNTKFGEARIQKCLYDSRRKDGFGDDCKAEIQSKITNAASDYRLDWKVKTKCLSDITAICPEEKKVADSSFFESGVVISCMKKSLGKIKDKTCRNEIVRVAGVQAEHISANKPAMNACSADITRFCPTVKKGEGKLQSCLRSHLQQLSDPCRAQEFKDMVVESADIEMKPKMARICKPSIKKFCTDMTHGDARIFDCLSEHKDDEDMDAACAEEIQADEELTAKDWRLKFGVSHQCEADIDDLCSTEKASKGASGEGMEGVVLQCLVDARKKIKKAGCKTEINKLMKSQASNFKNNPQLVAACGTDVSTHCADVEPGHGRVHECLSAKMKSLSLSCKSEEFLQMVASSEKVVLNPMLKAVCKTTLKAKCADVKDEDGALLRCLEDHADDDATPKLCHDAIGRMSKMKNTDFRLNPMLAKNCEADINDFCADAKTASQQGDELSGKVLQCLIDNRKDLKKPACKSSIMRKQIQRTSNVKNDPGQMGACSTDIKTYCDGVEEGEGRVHKCLFENMKNLSPECKEKEFKTQTMMTESVKLNPSMNKQCKPLVAKYCSDVPPGRALMKCLNENKDKDDVPTVCRTILENQQIKESKNIKFKPGTNMVCAPDLGRLKATGKCPKANVAPSMSLGGENLQCLVDNEDDVKSAACKGKIREQNKATSQDLRAKPGGVGGCATDIGIYCSDVTPGGGRRNKCLQDNMRNLSPECAKIQNNIMDKEAKDATISPTLQKSCFSEQKMFCAEEKEQAHSQILACLKSNVEKEGFGDACKKEVERFKVPAVLLKFIAKSKTMGTKELATEVLKSDEFADLRNTSSIQIKGGLALLALSSLVIIVAYMCYIFCKKQQSGVKGYTVVIPKT
mmetsp:Transcript_96994/g.277531  ORF Transcript_96994/g.277531 Transcript_96994/m.277531 type:complete len:1109 (-) Transcript_96994:154-3480(-)|eukprot:CAMPEP_0119473090 /NCGR_PEP_ID=MMETSP1344-20130328/4879_1 /TAXON_ID=236787 /ORGANISM="Florenciella parvula, Strain CCMP2471" /LENGTH=1108 /DNA_ID=CAMNT_0007506141 /DNA_START=89 /DNA_END=3415 /DNA_ORIENTATION=+